MLRTRIFRVNQIIRNMAIISGPPSVYISFGEKILHAMFSIRSAVRATSQVRQMTSVISGPPSNHISTVEKLCHGIVITLSCLSLPAYVLSHMRQYRGIED